MLTAVGGIRTDPASLTPPATPGRSDRQRRQRDPSPTRASRSPCPAAPGATFDNEWIAVLPTAANAIPGPASNAATFDYAPITGERDQLGQLRQDDPNVPNVGFGSRPFFDIGAFEFVQYFPPQVEAFSSTTNVQATLADGTTKDIYSVGGISGVNQQPQSIADQVQRGSSIPPRSPPQSVVLVGSGGDGIFGNGNDVTFSLAGRLSYANTASGSILTINMAGLNLPTDEYELILDGTGSNVIKNLQGNALDGENTPNDNPNGVQQALPSGTGTPGSNFYLQFTIDMHAPSLVPGTLHARPVERHGESPVSSRTNNTPSFTGQITDIFPPANPLQGDTVFLDVFDQTTGQWVQVGQSTTNATGNFTVAVSSPLPDTPYNVGPDGLLGTADDIEPGHGAGPDRRPGGECLERLHRPAQRLRSRGAAHQLHHRHPGAAGHRGVAGTGLAGHLGIGDDLVHGRTRISIRAPSTPTRSRWSAPVPTASSARPTMSRSRSPA